MRNEGGDPRELTQLVTAINQAGVGDRLKVAAFDDTPASMTAKKNEIKHGRGGYTPLFDMGDATGAGVQIQDVTGGFNVNWWDAANVAPATTSAISLKAHANGMYVTAQNGGAQPLIANRATIGAWEEFDSIVN